jgi:hypothetical protein
LLNEYLSRNKAINKSTKNQSYREATRIKSTLVRLRTVPPTSQELKTLNNVLGIQRYDSDKTIKKLTRYSKRHVVKSKLLNTKDANNLLKKLNAKVTPIVNALDKISRRFYETNLQNEIFNEIQISELTNDQLTPN